jgi:hypothetical protein
MNGKTSGCESAGRHEEKIMVDLYFSLHAARRCLERGIPPDKAREAVWQGRIVRSYADADMYALDRIMVVVGRCSHGVVTVFRRPEVNIKRITRKSRKARKKAARSWR